MLGRTVCMVYSIILIYLRDFAPNHPLWAADYGIGKHLESRLAHVHGALFSLLNLVLGLVVPRLNVGEGSRAGIAGLVLAGLLMLGGLPILGSFGWAGVAALKALPA